MLKNIGSVLSLILCFAVPSLIQNEARAAFTANTQYYIWQNADANNANGCGFDSTIAGAGTNYANQQHPQYALTGGTSVGAGSVVLHASSAADMVGNLAHITGTNTTSDWYQVTSVVVGVSMTFDKAVTTGAGAAIVLNIGGACSLGSATASFTDDLLFEHSVPGNIWYIKYSASSYVPTAVSVAAACTVASQCLMEGFNTTPGDRPITRGTRPTINNAANAWATTGNMWIMRNLNFTPTNAAGISISTSGGKFIENHCINKSATADRTCLTVNASVIEILDSEFVSYLGPAIVETAGSYIVRRSYIHDSNYGVNTSSISKYYYDNLFENFTTGAVLEITAHTISTSFDFYNNTFVGTPAHTNGGYAINLLTGSAGFRSQCNNFVGLSGTAVSHADSSNTVLDDWNNYFNNGTDVSNVTKGSHDKAVDPQFPASWVIYSGTTGTTSGSVLTQSGGTFPTFTVEGQPAADYLHIVSGSGGISTGVFGINSNTGTTITTDRTIGTNGTANTVYYITRGHNFAVGPKLNGLCGPGLIPGSATTNYKDIGAAQRRMGFPQRGH